tara:strand:+ start:447 stop:638 length:192 start_codon:yes stop_codon:yes gene_type:complete
MTTIKFEFPYASGVSYFFRDQNITSGQHLKLGKRFDDLHVRKTISKVQCHPLAEEVRKEPDQS